MSEMFYSASSFDHDIRVWNVKNLLQVDDMFSKADRMKEVFNVHEKTPMNWLNSLAEKNTSILSADCMKICDLDYWEKSALKDLGSIVSDKFGKQVIGNDKLLSTDDSKLSPFLLAAKANGTLEIQNWIKLSLEASDSKSLGISKLHIAAAAGNVSEIKSEIENGTDVNLRTKLGHTPLHYAAAYGSVKNLRYLLKSGAKIDTRGKWGETAFHVAAASETDKNLKYLLRKGGIKMPKDKNGMTPLHFAAGFGNTEAISTLLNLGADANRPDKMGSAPVFYSNVFRKIEALKVFGSHEKSCECKN